ncbi:MAG: cytochrome b6-f complex subunit PetL [Jaaginema sp. PMC 1079.18]|nr:cytochrome b6-f complex subunit PetL [Jaaginema sp. PMC 1080.18]MEC4853597.1 cytochrome b6-f complex subunit PetL [Jaaginema sp. PMC 1079.18]MEC4868162.1 cytochrome b6-f complex subunit PetL [Jaaginema sp. PMC 1078.18]
MAIVAYFGVLIGLTAVALTLYFGLRAVKII